MRPGPKLAPETGANKSRDNPHIFFRQPEHLRDHALHIEDALRLLVDGQLVSAPYCRSRLKLDWVVGLRRRDVGLIDLHWCVGESFVRIAALTLEPFRRCKRCLNL